MNTKNNFLPNPEQVFQDMLESGDIDFGIMSDGLCDTPEAQAEFDKNQKNKAPLTE